MQDGLLFSYTAWGKDFVQTLHTPEYNSVTLQVEAVLAHRYKLTLSARRLNHIRRLFS
jgi:hypothetical protein